MEPEAANKLVDEWGVLLLLNTPKDMQFGIDHQSWQVGTKFKGIKLLPPGPHYVHYALHDEVYMAKLGFFVYVKPKMVSEGRTRSVGGVQEVGQGDAEVREDA